MHRRSLVHVLPVYYWFTCGISEHALVTIQTATLCTHNNANGDKLVILFSSIAWNYGDNDFIIWTFDCIACSDTHTWLVALIWVLTWLTVKNTDCVQLQGFPIDSCTLVWVRRTVWKIVGAGSCPVVMTQWSKHWQLKPGTLGSIHSDCWHIYFPPFRLINTTYRLALYICKLATCCCKIQNNSTQAISSPPYLQAF